jgi:hypothetical protein
MYSETVEDVERLTRMSTEMLWLQLEAVTQTWYADLVYKEILRRQNSPTDKSVAIVLKKST